MGTPRAEWAQPLGAAFSEGGAELAHGYPADRVRLDDVRPAGDPRYTHPESVQASVTNGTTTAPFITFSGVPDSLSLDPGTDECVFTCRDDGGRVVGTVSLSAGGAGPFPIRCRSVDVTNNGAAASVVSVTGYYLPAQRSRPALTDDYRGAMARESNHVERQ